MTFGAETCNRLRSNFAAGGRRCDQTPLFGTCFATCSGFEQLPCSASCRKMSECSKQIGLSIFVSPAMTQGPFEPEWPSHALHVQHPGFNLYKSQGEFTLNLLSGVEPLYSKKMRHSVTFLVRICLNHVNSSVDHLPHEVRLHWLRETVRNHSSSCNPANPISSFWK